MLRNKVLFSVATLLAFSAAATRASVLDREGTCPVVDCYNIQCSFESFTYKKSTKASTVYPKTSYQFEALCEAIWLNNSIILVPAEVRGNYDAASKKVSEIADIGGPFAGKVLTTATCQEDPYIKGNSSCSNYAWNVNLQQGNAWYAGLDSRRLPFGEGKITQGMIDAYLEQTGEAKQPLQAGDLSDWNPFGQSKPQAIKITQPGNYQSVKLCDPPGFCGELVLQASGGTPPEKIEGDFQRLVEKLEVVGDIAMPADKPYPVWQAIYAPLKTGHPVAWNDLPSTRGQNTGQPTSVQMRRQITEQHPMTRKRPLATAQNIRYVHLFTGKSGAPFTPGFYRVRVRGVTGNATGWSEWRHFWVGRPKIEIKAAAGALGIGQAQQKLLKRSRVKAMPAPKARTTLPRKPMRQY